MKKTNQTNENTKKQNISYDNCNTRTQKYFKSELDKNAEEINDNISEKANSVQTSYKYHKNKKGPNSSSSKEQNDNYHYHYDEPSIEMSENDNLICPNCINWTLIDEKKKRDNLNEMRDLRNKEYEQENTNAIIDKNRNYKMDLINEKRRQREKNINNAYQNLAKIKAGMSSKDKLIQINENSRNPLNEGYPDYQYQNFQDEYERRQKMINDNKDKYYPNAKNERQEISAYYEKYVNNPNYDKNKENNYYDERDRERDNYNNNDKKEYLKFLEEQIRNKNEIKRREKEEDQRRGQKLYEEIQKELKKEEQERYLKEQRKREEFIKDNFELIHQKDQRKIKELEEQIKYRELCDKQNDDYLRELEMRKIAKEKLRDEIYNQNRNEYEIKQKNKLFEKEKEKEKKRINYDNNEYDYQKDQYGKKYEDRDFDINNRPKYDNRDNKYEERYRNYEGNNDYKDYRDKNINREGHKKVKERMGRCCRCHKIFPRKLLSINNYFYKENRV